MFACVYAARTSADTYVLPAFPITEPFFNVLRFFLSTYFNTMAKKKQVALARREALKKGPQNHAEKDAGDAEIRRTAENK